ncbi:MAG: hypothetical protein QOH85_1015, partial [Acidobacteriaceae bacterium]|nr:hypothetical protein [Acidobacteriaceae bacterium]
MGLTQEGPLQKPILFTVSGGLIKLRYNNNYQLRLPLCWLDRISDHICQAWGVDRRGFGRGTRPTTYVGAQDQGANQPTEQRPRIRA